VWDFQCKERTRPLQQYARVFPKRGAFTGRIHALQAAEGADGPLAVVRKAHTCSACSKPHLLSVPRAHAGQLTLHRARAARAHSLHPAMAA
jgi:hypothetical protein